MITNIEMRGQHRFADAYYSDMDTNKMSDDKLTALTKKEQIADLNPEALFADGFENALLGYNASSFCAVYDYTNCLDILHKQGMTPEEAHEHMEFNVVGAYVGDFTPSFIHTFVQDYE
jgi:hypothetical protein